MRPVKELNPPSWLASTLMIAGMVALCVVGRLVPHPPNFTPVAAVALFAGAAFARSWVALAVPVVAMLASDALIGLHGLAPVVYGAMMINVSLGRWVRRNQGATTVLAASLAGSLAFFLITNFACWISFYESSWTGLVTCYTAALPFFENSLAGNLTYTAVLFGTAAWVTRARGFGVASPTAATR